MDRKYINRVSKRFYESTELGRSVITIFEEIWPDLVSSSFTRFVEEQMDLVASEEAKYEDMKEKLRLHYLDLHKKLMNHLDKFKTLLKKTNRPIKTNKQSRKTTKILEGEPCPLCTVGVIRTRLNNKTNEKFLGCSNFPSCRWTSPIAKKKQ
jgi:DNA topoisomerase-1